MKTTNVETPKLVQARSTEVMPRIFEVPLHRCLRATANGTRRVAEIPTWKLTRKHEREMHKLAVNNPKGYWIGSVAQMKEQFGDLFDIDRVADSKPNQIHVWAITSRILFRKGDELYWAPMV